MRAFPKTALLPLLLLLLVGLPTIGQNAAIPPISWTCPMHPDVIEDHGGTCPVCAMKLVPTRIDYTWSCPVHSVIDEGHSGKCPICRRDLVQMTVTVTYVCADKPKTEHLNPGKCANGRPMTAKHTLRAHGNHSPQYGGLFFMASDSWHHLEGTLPEPGLFRLHLYNDYSKPLPAAEMRQVTGTLTRGNAVLPLKPGADGRTLEVRDAGLVVPTSLVAKVKFKKEGPEYRFDFVFSSAAPVAPTVADAPPEKTADLVKQLGQRKQEISDLITAGRFAEVYVPAFQAKDLALVLDQRARELPLVKRAAVSAAIERLVRTAWQLDAAGDLGERARIMAIFTTFAAEADDVIAAFSAGQR